MALVRYFTALVSLASLVAIAAPATNADEYPSRTVKIIVPFGAGGPTDVYTRAIAEELRKSLHQTFVMENRPGAGTTIGTDAVAKAAPDGYTLVMISTAHVISPHLYKQMPYDPIRDFTP